MTRKFSHAATVAHLAELNDASHAAREDRHAAYDRERRFRAARDDMRQISCALIRSVPLTHSDILEAIRFARAADRIEIWREQAWRRSLG